MYTAPGSELNRKCSKQANLSMIGNGENKCYIVIKNLSRLLNSLNAIYARTYHFCINCLNGFHTALAGDKHFKYCGNDVHVKFRCLLRKKNG